MMRQYAPSINHLIDDAKAGIGTDGTNSRTLAHSDLRNLGSGTTENPWDSAGRSAAGVEQHKHQNWLQSVCQSSNSTGKDPGATVDVKWNVCQQCAPTLNK